MAKYVNLHDEGIKDIRTTVEKVIELYKKEVKKDPAKMKDKPRLKIWFKRGPITMKNGEWSKLDYEKLTLDVNKITKFFERKNLNWGMLGYGDVKSGIKGLMKYAKTKLNPKQLLGEGQDLKMTINKYQLIDDETHKYGKAGIIIITVPDKSLGGSDIQSSILKKHGYLGINAWKEESLKLLSDNPLDKIIKSLLEEKVKITDIMKEDLGEEGEE